MLPELDGIDSCCMLDLATRSRNSACVSGSIMMIWTYGDFGRLASALSWSAWSLATEGCPFVDLEDTDLLNKARLGGVKIAEGVRRVY